MHESWTENIKAFNKKWEARFEKLIDGEDLSSRESCGSEDLDSV